MTMPDPRGPLSQSEYLMGQALLQSDEFKLFAKDSTESPAVDRIKYGIIERPDPDLDYFTLANLEASRPFVCIYPFNVSMLRIGSQAIQANGSVQMLFECNYNDATDDDVSLSNESEILRWWKNRIGVMLVEAFSESHDVIFNMLRFGQLSWWTRSLIKPEDEHLGFTCVAEWGVDQT